jgi:uncharacterized membrane protein
MTRLVFAISIWDWLAVAAVTVVFSAFAVINTMRAERRLRAFLIELPRLLTAVFLACTLLEPELVHVDPKEKKPGALVLVDSSPSMQTKDEVGEAGKGTRAAVAEELAQSPMVEALRERYAVGVDHFAGSGGASDGTDIEEALRKALASRPDLRAVLLVSDGDWNMGQPPAAAALRYQARGVSIFGIGVGRDREQPDVRLEDVRVPSFCVLNERVVIPFSLRNHLRRSLDTTVTLASSDGQTDTRHVSLAPGGVLRDSFLWRPSALGDYTVRVSVPTERDDEDHDNNAVTSVISVRREVIKVLVIESRPRWEYRFIRNALFRDPGVEVNTLLFHQQGMTRGGGPGYIDAFPDSKEKLSAYDVVFLGDVSIGSKDTMLTNDQAELIRGLVEKQASGLVFMPGPAGGQASIADTPLGELYPVVLDKDAPNGKGSGIPATLALTELGSDHLLTSLADSPAANRALWRQLPGFYWYAAVTRAKPGSDVLAVHSVERGEWGRIPLLVTRPWGNGRVLFMGTDSAWRWRRGVEDRYHYRFWGQVVRWMAHRRHVAAGRSVRLFHTPERPVQGDTVELRVTAFDAAGFPLENTALQCRVTAPGAEARDLDLRAESGGWGTYEGSFAATTAGEHVLHLHNPEGTVSFETKLEVMPKTREPIGRPARHDVLREVSRLTDGRFGDVQHAKEVLSSLQSMPERERQARRTRLWCTWWWGLIPLLLMGIHWVSRKAAGLI